MRRKIIIRSIVATISSLLLLFVSYLYNNHPYPSLDDIEHYSWLEYIQKSVFGVEPCNDSVVYINVAYDKQLINLCDSNNIPLGNIDITNRRSLIKFLRLLKKEPSYKYIFLDVRFEKGYADNSLFDANDSLRKTVDETLFSEIIHTPRLVAATHDDLNPACDSILPKLALSDYKSTIITTNFVRYEYLHGNQVSVPLYIYSDCTGHKFSKWGPFIFDNGNLCHNCPFLRIPHSFSKQDETNVLNLGTDILDEESGIGSDIIELVKGKYVIIGNMVNDQHDTYIGLQPGCYISYIAFDSLMKQKHLVNWWSVLIVGVLYFIITFLLYSKLSILAHFPYLKKLDSKIIRFILSFIGIAFVIYCITDVIYLFTGETFCIWIPSMYFTVFRAIINNK